MKEKLNGQMRRVTLKQLRALAATVQAGTASRAAQALNITPPAVTMQLRLLEESVGMPLLDRTKEGLRLTDGGREVLATANRIEAALAECGEALEAMSGVDVGRVSVGVISTAKYFAPRMIAAFAKAHPKVDIRLLVGNREETIAALRSYEIDFAIMGRPPEDNEVEKTVVGDHPHIIVAPADHPLARRRQIDLKELASETFLLREQGSGTRLLMQRLFADAGLSPTLGMEIGSNETIKQAVMAGLGIALLSAHTVSAEIDDGRLTALKVRGLPIVRQWFAVKQRDKRLLPAGQSLWDFFVTSGEKFLPRTRATQRKG